MKVSALSKKILLVLLLSLALPVYTFASEENLYKNPQDPYEKFNRAMFQFNELVDKFFFKPIATVYVTVFPKPFTKGFSNFFNNIDTLSTFLNDLLQANFYQATSDFWRLLINTTLGAGGFFDVAVNFGLEPNKEDFGLTLAQWGYKDSVYLVLPFLGPGTLRDQIGMPINYEFLSIYPYVYPTRTRYALYFASLIVRRGELLHFEDVMEQAALDKYTFVRDAYLQRRNYQIERNKQLGDPYLEKNDASNDTGPP